jgi:hypothetical protein
MFSVLAPSGSTVTSTGFLGLHSGIKQRMIDSMSIFDEQYRVVGVDGDRLTVKGVHTGDVLTIVPPEPQEPLSRDEYPVGKLIALSDPSEKLFN